MLHCVSKNNIVRFKSKGVVFLSENTLGLKIKTLRKTRGITQDDLAKRLGVQRATISNYEIGRRTPSVSDLEKLGSILGVSLEYFGVKTNEVHDLIARAKLIFDNEEIPHQEKSKVYKEIMRLYLEMDE